MERRTFLKSVRLFALAPMAVVGAVRAQSRYLTLEMVRKAKATKLKPPEKRQMWPTDWSDIKCPECKDKHIALSVIHKDKRTIGCRCYRCRCDFTAIWEVDKKEWFVSIHPKIEHDHLGDYISFGALVVGNVDSHLI